jgi:hypothetical protein
MSSDPSYFQNLQTQGNASALAELRTLAFEFSGVLNKFPRAKSDLDALLQYQEGVDYTLLSQRVEQQLNDLALLDAKILAASESLLRRPHVKKVVETSKQEASLRTSKAFLEELLQALGTAIAQRPPDQEIEAMCQQLCAQFSQHYTGKFSHFISGYQILINVWKQEGDDFMVNQYREEKREKRGALGELRRRFSEISPHPAEVRCFDDIGPSFIDGLSQFQDEFNSTPTFDQEALVEIEKEQPGYITSARCTCEEVVHLEEQINSCIDQLLRAIS